MALADSVNQELVETFTAKATAVNAMVQELPSMAAALQYVVDVCESKQPAGLLADEPGVDEDGLINKIAEARDKACRHMEELYARF